MPLACKRIATALFLCLAPVSLFAQSLEIGAGDLVATVIPGVRAATRLVVPNVLSPASIDPAVPGAALLNSLIARGQSQGFGGMLYENRDRGHSTLAPTLFPGLVHLRYDSDLAARGADYGLASGTVILAPLVGNSSTALTRGLFWRSLPRIAMTSQLGPATAFAQYSSDSLYLYPEHRDHDERDLYPANWPYTVTSQGSSGSDQPFLRALLMTLAAFPADTRAALVERHEIAPTLQMILRRTQLGINSDDDYLGAAAHPSVFDGARLRPGRMIALAAAMKPDALPPLVRVDVESEGFLDAAGLTGQSEKLFTTPAAIARLWRDMTWQREMVIDAGGSTDAGGRPLTIRWVLLRGDPARVSIEPLDSAGTRARLTIAWHDAFPAPGLRTDAQTRLTSRVDIGIFADNGISLSAPAFVSVTFPSHQARAYAPGPGGAMVLHSVDYDAAGRSAEFDPRLFWTGPWRDDMTYDAEGKLTGWHRHQSGKVIDFAADGRLADGRIVHYATPNRALPMLLDWQAN